MKVHKRVAALYHAVRTGWASRYFPPKPVVARLLIDGTPNTDSRAHTALREPTEVSHELLQQVLSDPAFTEIRQVQLVASEPIQRPALPDVGHLLVKSLPNLTHVQLLTDGRNIPPVDDQVPRLARVLQTAGLRFGICVSLGCVLECSQPDDVVPDSLAAACDAIRAWQQFAPSVAVSTTLTPGNLYLADDVMLLCARHGVSRCIFRLAPEIESFNPDFSRRDPLTPEKRFHLIMLFAKLAHDRHVAPARRRYYRRLVDQLTYTTRYRAKSHERIDVITLDMRGCLHADAEHTSVLGSALEHSAWLIYKQSVRQELIPVNDGNCWLPLPQNAYHPTLGELADRGMAAVSRQIRKRRFPSTKSLRHETAVRPAERSAPEQWRRVLITGWYGTETAGDKAILGEVLHFLKTYAPGCEVVLTSIDRKVSRQTQLELADLRGAKQIDLAEGHKPALIESVDAVIIGGGPLMQTSKLQNIRSMFLEANRQRKARIVFGCGVGPLHTDGMSQVAGDILRLSSAGFLRDAESHAYALRLAPENHLVYACDPALGYVHRWKRDYTGHDSLADGTLRIAGLLRENTREFVADQTGHELTRSNARFAREIAQVLQAACDSYYARVDLLHMNAHWLGGDDRIFNRQVARCFDDPRCARVVRHYMPLASLLEELDSADMSVPMRYHGHLFSMALGIPFLSIDYTGQHGKVRSLVERVGYQEWCEDWHRIDVRQTASRVGALLDERMHWSNYLRHQTAQLVAQLNRTYTEVFDVT